MPYMDRSIFVDMNIRPSQANFYYDKIGQEYFPYVKDFLGEQNYEAVFFVLLKQFKQFNYFVSDELKHFGEINLFNPGDTNE